MKETGNFAHRMPVGYLCQNSMLQEGRQEACREEVVQAFNPRPREAEAGEFLSSGLSFLVYTAGSRAARATLRNLSKKEIKKEEEEEEMRRMRKEEEAAADRLLVHRSPSSNLEIFSLPQ